MVQARLLRRRPAAGLARQRRGPHRPDRAGLGGAVRAWRRRTCSAMAHGGGGGAPGGPRGRAWSSCSTRRWCTRVPSAGYIQAYPPRRARKRRPVFARRRVGADGAGPAGQPRRRTAADSARRRRHRLPLLHLPEPGAPRAPRRRRARSTASSPTSMAGDVYTQPPYVGRGGWSWYTGAAGLAAPRGRSSRSSACSSARGSCRSRPACPRTGRAPS